MSSVASPRVAEYLGLLAEWRRARAAAGGEWALSDDNEEAWTERCHDVWLKMTEEELVELDAVLAKRVERGTMKVTGYQIREAITRNKLRRETASSQFADSLHLFPGEQKRSPESLSLDIGTAERRIAQLQVAQDAYNAAAGIALSIKTIGGLERLEKLWRSAAVKKKDRFSFSRENPLLRDEKQVAAVLLVRPEEAVKRVEEFTHQIAELHAAIGVANGKEIDIDLDPSVFD